MLSPRLARALAWCRWHKQTGCWPLTVETGRPPSAMRRGRATPRGTRPTNFEIRERSTDMAEFHMVDGEIDWEP